jgi:hypothetical protein
MKRIAYILAGLISLSFVYTSAQNKQRAREEYVKVVKDFYNGIYSSQKVSVKETMNFFNGEWVAEMEEYLFFEDCEKNKKRNDCDELFQQLYYRGSQPPPSLFFAKIKEQKAELTQGLKTLQIAHLLDSCSVLIDDNCPDCILLFLPFPNGGFIYFSMNKYVDEPITINNIYLKDGSSFYNKIYSEQKGYLKRFGIVNDPDGYTNIRKGPGTDNPITGLIKTGESFYYIPNANTKWWLVQKIDTPSVAGYVYYDRIAPKNSTNGSQNTKKETQTEDSINYQTQQGQSLQKDTLETEVIYDDEFIMRVIENDLTFSNLKKIYQPKEIHEKLLQNKHNLNKKDTLLIFIAGIDSIGFYKGWGNVLPQKMVITSEKLVIDKDIKVGVDKSLFRQKFKNKLLSDTLVVKDTEGGNTFTFFFKENNLFQIIYKAEYTD